MRRKPAAASPLGGRAGAYFPGHSCARCVSTSDDERKRRHLIDLLALIENPAALPPALALRLGAEIVARLEDEPRHFVCEAIGDELS